MTDDTRLNDLLNRVGNTLRHQGERLSTPRRAVLTAMANSNGHLTVEQIAQQVGDLDSSIHLASIYRSLDTFIKLNIVQHVHLGHGSVAYHLVDNTKPHPHIQCRMCGVVWDVAPHLLDDVAKRLSNDNGFTLDPTHVALSGTCAGCHVTTN